jgi:hypothetical protein
MMMFRVPEEEKLGGTAAELLDLVSFYGGFFGLAGIKTAAAAAAISERSAGLLPL